jgi:hypothetical protein
MPKRLHSLGIKAYSAEQSRLGALLRPFKLADRCDDRFDLQRDELLASAYLHHEISRAQLVDWAENALLDGEFRPSPAVGPE